jgi:enterochelin esterase-like enzyme
MKPTLLLLLSLLALSVKAQIPGVATGRVQRFAAFSSKFVEPRNIDVWLPEGYTPAHKYAVLYLHDGQALFDSAIMWNKQEWGVDETLGKLIAEHEVRDCLVVGIWNTASRHSEYFPQKPFESLTRHERDSIIEANRRNNPMMFKTDVHSDAYLRFIVTELKPFIDAHFSTFSDQRNTFMAGSSMGGLISIYALCEYPDVFFGAGCLSTHWPGLFNTEHNPIPDAFLRYLRAHLPPPENHKIYFDYGTATLDAMYKPWQGKVDQLMTAAGYSAANWITREFPGADHSEKAWKKRLATPLKFLLAP